MEQLPHAARLVFLLKTAYTIPVLLQVVLYHALKFIILASQMLELLHVPEVYHGL